MESDINLIIEVEPGEAAVLIELIEQLMEEWYIHRHNRTERMRRVKEIAMEKKAARSGGKKSEADNAASSAAE